MIKKSNQNTEKTSANTLTLAKTLIDKKSITPQDAGCQKILAARLLKMGFSVEHLRFGDVDNLWARKGTAAPLFVFAGHTDVVPAGDVDKWQTPPFQASVKKGILYGRGSADMKSAIAAFVCALEKYLQTAEIKGSIGLLITSDEEGIAINGTAKVMAYLAKKNAVIDYCLIGEPSADKQVGDVIKVGRRGSLNGTLVIEGKQGHIAYPDLAANAIHLALPALAKLTEHKWDKGNAYFSATQCQISNIKAGTGATNVIPGTVTAAFNFRYSTETNEAQLKKTTQRLLNETDLNYHIDWHLSGEPFLSKKGLLSKACIDAIKKVTGQTTKLATTGGTSDGRFIAPYGVEVVELGVCNATIHQVNECVSLTELKQLTDIYFDILCCLMS